MIIYNKKKLQTGGTAATPTASWYTDPNTQSLVNQASTAVNTSPKYTNTATQGNMLGSEVTKIDKNEGEWESALTGAGTGAVTGAAAGSVVPGIGTAAGAVVGAVVGGAAGWLSKDSENQGKIDQYNKEVNQAKSNYAANAQNMYADQYSAYKQAGGQLNVGANQIAQRPLIPQPSMAPEQQMVTPNVQGRVVQQFGQNNTIPQTQQPTVQPQIQQPTGQVQQMSAQPVYRSGGSFSNKINLLINNVPKKA